MAVKSNFASGDVLTSSDVNTYLTNGGLVYVKQQAIGTGVASVSVSNAFSSDYVNYRIIYEMGDSSSIAELLLKFNNSTGSTYSHGGTYVYYGNTTLIAETANNSSSGIRVGNSNTGLSSCAFDVISPYGVNPTHVMSNHADADYWSVRGGRDSNAASQTGFSLQPSAGTLTGGTIYVYGYRKA